MFFQHKEEPETHDKMKSNKYKQAFHEILTLPFSRSYNFKHFIFSNWSNLKNRSFVSKLELEPLKNTIYSFKENHKLLHLQGFLQVEKSLSSRVRMLIR